MIEGVGRATVRRPPEAIIAFVTDLERYRQADLKIGRVLEQRRTGARVFMRHDGRLRGVPGPAVSLEVEILGERAVRYRSLPSFPSRWLLTFEGGFELTATVDGDGGRANGEVPVLRALEVRGRALPSALATGRRRGGNAPVEGLA